MQRPLPALAPRGRKAQDVVLGLKVGWDGGGSVKASSAERMVWMAF